MVPDYSPIKLAYVALATLALVACGGTGGTSTPASPTPPASSITVSGTAATGKALVGATVAIKCATGTGSATTGSDGSYVAQITGGVLPCAVQISDGTSTYHSVAPVGASSAKANVTPFTSLVIASLAGGDPAQFYSSFDTVMAARVTAGAISAAVTSVRALLANAGVDLSAVTDLISGTLVAATASRPSTDPHDLALEQFKTSLSGSSLTFSSLVANVAQESAGSGRSLVVPTGVVNGLIAGTSNVPSLPASLQFAKPAGTCSALRSGKYYFVLPHASNVSLPDTVLSGTLDSATLSWSMSTGATRQWTSLTDTCRFATATPGDEAVVSQAGVIVSRVTSAPGVATVMIGVPAQNHTVAELAGDWNGLGMTLSGTDYIAESNAITVDAAGSVVAHSSCSNAVTWSITGGDCAPVTLSIAVVADASTGAFLLKDTVSNSVLGKIVAYQAGSGEWMLVFVSLDGSFQVFTRKRTVVLPAVDTQATTWNVSLTKALQLTASTTETSNLVKSTNAANASWVREAWSGKIADRSAAGSSPHLETINGNQPRDGFLNRPASANVPLTVGSGTTSINEWSLLVVRGLGVHMLITPSIKVFTAAVIQP